MYDYLAGVQGMLANVLLNLQYFFALTRDDVLESGPVGIQIYNPRAIPSNYLQKDYKGRILKPTSLHLVWRHVWITYFLFSFLVHI